MADYNGVRWSSLITVLLGVCGLGGGSVGWGLNTVSRQTEENRAMLMHFSSQTQNRWENHTMSHPSSVDISRLMDRIDSLLREIEENKQ